MSDQQSTTTGGSGSTNAETQSTQLSGVTAANPGQLDKGALPLNRVVRDKLVNRGEEHWYKVTIPARENYIVYFWFPPNLPASAEPLIRQNPHLFGVSAQDQDIPTGSSVAHGAALVSKLLGGLEDQHTFYLKIKRPVATDATVVEYELAVLII
jgi:hypothetical protein